MPSYYHRWRLWPLVAEMKRAVSDCTPAQRKRQIKFNHPRGKSGYSKYRAPAEEHFIPLKYNPWQYVQIINGNVAWYVGTWERNFQHDFQQHDFQQPTFSKTYSNFGNSFCYILRVIFLHFNVQQWQEVSFLCSCELPAFVSLFVPANGAWYLRVRVKQRR